MLENILKYSKIFKNILEYSRIFWKNWKVVPEQYCMSRDISILHRPVKNHLKKNDVDMQSYKLYSSF